MNNIRLITALLSFIWISSIAGQGPPIYTETPILLGLDGGGVRTFGKFISRENIDVYIHPIGIPYNIGSKTQIGIIGKYIRKNPTGIPAQSGLGDLAVFAKQQLYSKNGRGKTFRTIARLTQVFPTGKTNTSPPIGLNAYQTQVDLVSAYITLNYGIYGQIGYNLTTNGLADRWLYGLSFVYPLLPQKYPPSQINLNIGVNGGYTPELASHSLLVSPGIQWIAGKRVLFETGVQLPLIEDVPDNTKTRYIITLGTRILLF